MAANESNKKIVEQERQAHLRKDAKIQSEAQDLANLMKGLTLEISSGQGRRKRSALPDLR